MSEVATERPSDALIGQVLASRYLIEQRLGEGAMGTVYKARHVKVGRPFAVKVLHKRLLEDLKIAQRFEREAELAGRLRHPNVIGVVDVGETPDGFRYMVMDFAEGSDLATLLAEAPMPPARIIHLARLLLEGLYHAHEAGLIHRDFKPENVIVERDDHDIEVPRIVDFGIAILREGGDSTSATGRLTTNGLVLGTPHYMAPEQAVADPIDHRIDLFAMGIVIYEMLSGRLPFDGNGAEVARANLLLDPPRIAERVPYLEVDPLLEAFARRLMAKRREARPATAKAAPELLDLIERDRAAAAAALGVPVQLGTRTNALTEPVSPQRAAVNEESGNHPQPQPAAVPATPPRPTDLEAPPVPIAVAPSRARDVSTSTAEPLAWGTDEPPRSRRGLVLAGLGLLAIGGIVAAAVLRGDHDRARASAPVAVTTPAPAPAPIEPPPAPTDMAASPTTTDTPASDPPVPPTTNTAPLSSEPATASATPAATPPAPERARKPARVTRPAKLAPTKPAEVAPTKPVEVTAPTPPAPAPPPTTGVTVNALVAQYTAVGQQLKALGDQANDLWPRYRLIVLNDVIGTPETRAQAAAKLAQIQKLAAARK